MRVVTKRTRRLASLTACGLMIALAYWGDYSHSEIAARLAVPLGTIKSRAALGLRKLARALGAQER